MCPVKSHKDLTVTDDHDGWNLWHYHEHFAGPSDIVFDNVNIVSGCHVSFGNINTNDLILDTQRVWKKGQVVTVESRGLSKKNARIKLSNCFRYYRQFVKVLSELRLPKREQILDPISIGSIVLPNALDWCKYRTLEANEDKQLHLGPWGDLPSSEAVINVYQTNTKFPIAIVLEHASGICLEVGCGNDLWRWQKGVARSEKPLLFSLSVVNSDLHLYRYVSDVDCVVEPDSSNYRYTWYLSWNRNTTISTSLSNDHFIDPIILDGALDYAKTSNLFERSKLINGIRFDLSSTDWLPSQLSCCNKEYSKSNPCFANNRVTKKIKRILRQINELNIGHKPVLFTGFYPSYCENGRHVMREGTRPHWDLLSLVDLFSWTQKLFGEDVPIRCDFGELHCPSLQNLLQSTNITYETCS